MRYTLIIFFLLFVETISAQQMQFKIIHVEFSGLKRCKPDYISKCMLSEKLMYVDSNIIESDIQNIRNTDLFTSVSYTLDETPEGIILSIQVKEKLSIMPSVQGALTGDNKWFQIGFIDFHFLGKGITFAAFYKYFDKSSFLSYVNIPYINDSQWGLFTEFKLDRKEEPVYINDNPVFYNADYITVSLLLTKEIIFNRRIKSGFRYNERNYTLMQDDSSSTLTNEKHIERNIVIEYEDRAKLNFNKQYLTGFSILAIFQTAIIPYNDNWYTSFQFEGKYFVKLGKKGNLGLRNRIGLFENTKDVFVPLIHDSFVNIRGIGNTYDRGTAEFTLNTEYRHTAFDWREISLQLVGFADISALNQGKSVIKNLFNYSNTEIYVGPGFRLHFHKVSTLILRVDYGFSVIDSRSGFVAGLKQYF
ncbi:MAG: hypothetical protein GQ564_09360 [Bacteroidales bacterium]|nr:hypothetical protein [Bacteroidales bacterium]